MAKLQVAFWLLVVFTVMLTVNAGPLLDRMFDEPSMDDALLNDLFRSELSKRECADEYNFTQFCAMFAAQGYCERSRLYTHNQNFRQFRTVYCRQSCGLC